MTVAAGKPDSLPLDHDANPPKGGFSSAWLVAPASLRKVLGLAALPVVASIWALLSPPVVLSHEMTWDLLFNLAGAWQLHFGHVAHVDFHEPVGELNFLLTDVGFRLVGFGPSAFLVGSVLMAVALFVAAASVAWRRLPAVPAAIFIVFVCLLALMPANVGDRPTAYSFAMSYNRYGWSCISILFLVLFLPARPARRGDIVDIVVAAALLAAMFYLKMTYFLMGGAALLVAAFVCPHVRRAHAGWTAVTIGAFALAVAPFNRPYWADLLAAAGAGQVRNELSDYINDFLAYAGEYAPYIAALAVALWMWRRKDAPLRLPVATGVILIASAALLSQNAQTHGLPAAVVIVLLFYAVLRERRLRHLHGGSLGLLVALLVFPLLSVGTSLKSLTSYHREAMRQNLQTIDSTNLRGLAVRHAESGLLAAFSGGPADYHLLNRVRAVLPRFELSPGEYVETLLDAAALLEQTPGGPGRIVVLDQVNPFPFMLGLKPPRGGNLWSWTGAPVRAAEKVFADADHVLIPKFSTYGSWTDRALAAYGAHLDRRFPVRSENGSWILLSHGSTASVSEDERSPASAALSTTESAEQVP